MLMAIPSALSNAGNAIEGPVKLAKELWKQQRITTGYPETLYPHVPKILKKAKNYNSYKENIAVTQGEKGSEPAELECLNAIQGFVADNFKKTPVTIPRNTVAVTMCAPGFKVGSFNCHEIQVQDAQPTPGCTYTYKRLSSNVQVIYFNNPEGVQFLAAAVYYPTATGKIVTGVQNDMDLLKIEFLKMEPFPLADRATNENFKLSQRYGRYCNTAKARVLVWTGKKDGQIAHEIYNVFDRSSKYVGCDECAEDYRNYKWVEPVAEVPKKEEPKKEEPKKAELKLVEPKKVAVAKTSYIKYFGVRRHVPCAEKIVTSDSEEEFDKVDDHINFDAISIN